MRSCEASGEETSEASTRGTSLRNHRDPERARRIVKDSEPHPAFAAALDEERENLNSRFALRRHNGARIDGEALLRHLHECVEPLIRGVHGVAPERSRAAVIALFDVSLDLFAASLLGDEARSPCVRRVWKDVLPTMPRLVAREPQDVAACLSNAVYNVSRHPGGRDETWIARMALAGPRCVALSELLECGKVAAWQAGMTQHRPEGLAAARRLSTRQAAVTLSLPEDAAAERVQAAIDRMGRDPWLTAESAFAPADGTHVVSVVAKAGAFRGFGGLFQSPPTASLREGILVVEDGESEWRLMADACGTCFQRIGDARGGSKKGRSVADHPALDVEGSIFWDGAGGRFRELANATSQASDGTTLAVTIATSHHVFLLARTS